MVVISSASLLVIADTIEVSDQHRQVALYQWVEVPGEVDNLQRTWAEGTTTHSGTTMYALLELAQKAGLQVAAWSNGSRVW
jgi:hypothetical protein